MQKGFLLSSSGKRAPRAKFGSVPDSKLPSERDSSAIASTSRSDDGGGGGGGGGGRRRQHTMKKGFLLNPPPRSKASTTRSNASSKVSSKDIEKSKSSKEPKGGMKRGFLLAGKSNSKNDNTILCNSKRDEGPRKLPQCRQEANSEESMTDAKLDKSMQSIKRVTVASTALLDFGEPSNENGSDDAPQNEQSQPVVVSSLLRVIEDDAGDANEGSSFGYENDGLNDNNQSLDSWIQPTTSQQLPLVLPSKSNSSASKLGKPLIVEVEQKSPMMVEEMPKSSIHSPKPSNKSHDSSLEEISQADSLDKVGTKENETLQKVPRVDADQSTNLPNEADTAISLRFANDVSLLLAQLRHSMRAEKHSNDMAPGKKSSVGVGSFIGEQSSELIKSFVTKRLIENSSIAVQLNSLWRLALEPIAQDYSESTSLLKKKKKNRLKALISPSLALGLGVVEFLIPDRVVYESLANVLIEAANAKKTSVIPQNDTSDKDTTHDPNMDVQESRDRQLKIMALGAAYLVRCRIHSISVSIANLENAIRTSMPDSIEGTRSSLGEIQSELEIMLSKVLPALESVVASNASDGRTILTSAAADACFELIEASSRVVVVRYMFQLSTTSSDATDRSFINWMPPKSILVWREIMPIMDRLLAIKRHWVSRSEKPSKGNSNPSRVTCSMAVLTDWFDVIQSSKRQFFDHFIGDDLHEQGVDATAGLNLYWNLSGISFRREENVGSGASPCFRVGGMAQSLCGTPIHEISGFNSFGSADAEAFVGLIQESAKLTDSIRAARKKGQLSEAWTKENHQRAAIRAFASWLSRGSKAIRTLAKSSKRQDDAKLVDSALESILVLLRSDSKRCVDISIATISMLWSESLGWCAPEPSCDKTAEPKYFLELLDALHMHSTQQFSSDENEKQSTTPTNKDQLDSTSRALCAVISRVALQRPAYLLPYVLKMKGRAEIMIEVVLNMLEQLPSNKSLNDDSESNSPNSIVYHAASRMLVQNIESVSYLRLRLRSNPSLFTNVPCNIITPQIVEYLIEHYSNRKSSASVSMISGILCNIMKGNAICGHADDFVRCVVTSLSTIEEKYYTQKPSSTNDQTQSAAFFNKNGPLWRVALLKESYSSDCAYKDLLLATAKLMIEAPSNSTPLALLASLVDGQFSEKSAADENLDLLEKRISIATSGVINFASHQISQSRQNDIVKEETVFGRLAPFLILRRMPRSYYRAVHQVLPSDNEASDTVVGLATFLSNSLQEHALKNDQSNLAKEEKKLLAELAGHCLPFSSKLTNGKCSPTTVTESPVSLFKNICKRPFSDTLLYLREDSDVMQQDSICNIHKAKAALYASSHSVPLAVDEDDGEALMNVASFVFEVLNYQLGLSRGEPSDQVELIQREIAMLQSGCTHFLAVAMDSLSSRKATVIDPPTPTPLIKDLDCLDTSIEAKQPGVSIVEALSKMLHVILSIITTGEVGWESVYHQFYSFSRSNINKKCIKIHFAPASRMSMLNAIIMLSQGSQAEDNRLSWLAFTILPALIEWTSSGATDEGVRHPLCVAATLQVIYTLLARCGTFAWLSSFPKKGLNHPSETDFVCRTLQCALKSFHTSEGNSPTVSVLRLAALKVILTVIALNQANELESEQGLKGYLSPIEIQQAMSALHGAANVDQNPEVRRLANQIIPYLQTS